MMRAVEEFDEVVEQYHLAIGEFMKGNPKPAKKMFSHRDDVTLLTPVAWSRTDGSRLPRQWSVPLRLAEMARSLASRS